MNPEMQFENTVSSVRKHICMLATFIREYDTLINSYVLDYFVENHWQKIPVLWRKSLENIEPPDIAAFLEPHQELRCTEVWPLTLYAFRAAAFALALPRQAISSTHPVGRFLHQGVAEKLCNPENYYWATEHSNNCQNKNLPDMCRRHVKPKKQHEIHRLSQVMDFVLKNLPIDRIIDVGCGVGHLSRVLSLQYNLKVLTIDAVSSHASSATDFDKQMFPPSWPDNASFALLGLHACGDLSATVAKLFVKEPKAVALFSVGCCYMKLNTDNSSFGYPLSSFVKKLPHHFLSYEARELSCHALEKYKIRLKGNASSLKIHCYRAVLEKIITTHYPHSKHMGLRSVKHAECLRFSEYAQKALSKYDLQIPEADLLCAENEYYLQEWKKVVLLYSLRLLTAPVIESMILMDRMLFLLENGCHSFIFPIFEPALSPRNHLLIAVKRDI